MHTVCVQTWRQKQARRTYPKHVFLEQDASDRKLLGVLLAPRGLVSTNACFERVFVTIVAYVLSYFAPLWFLYAYSLEGSIISTAFRWPGDMVVHRLLCLASARKCIF